MSVKNSCHHKLRGLLVGFFIFFFLPSLLLAQTRTTISGYITDASTGEQLIGVNVYEDNSGLGTSANEYGFYSLTIPKGKCNLRFSFVGYASESFEFTLNRDTTINQRIKVDAVEFQEVVVTADQAKVDQNQMSMIDLPIEKLTKVPTIMGEPDVLKVIQLLPGVQSGSEGTSGIYVRGGGSDQNLFLLDGVPVYNVSHLFGFFSVFNPGSIKTVKLYKGGFPARYGGRLSSVVDIRMKEGNDQEFKGDVSIGLISSRLNLEGPIVKGKSSFVVSARRTYVDVLAQPIIAYYNKTSEGENMTGGYYFYDFNAKVNYKFSDKSRLYLSTYTGNDKLYMKYEYEYSNSFAYSGDYSQYQPNENVDKYVDKSDDGLQWGNRIAALRWNYVLGNKLFSNTTLTYSKYNFNTHMFYGEYELTNGTENTSSFDYFSSIRDLAAKIDFDYSPHPNHAVKFGTGFVAHSFEPGVQRVKVASADSLGSYSTSTPDNVVSPNEYYAYFEDNIMLGKRTKVNLGVHLSGINVQGKTYASLQPRFSARYKLTENASLKASYSKMNQYVHLLSSSAIDLPTDLWVPVTPKLKPPVSHQYAIGATMRLPLDLDFTIEGFYKSMDNLIAYRDGASFSGTATTNWDDMVEMGKGWSYGAELLLEKTYGKTTGWIGYTWAKSERQFDGLNFGKVFPAHYDRRHDFSFVATHVFSDRFDIGLTWVYSTGNAVSLGAYQYPAAPSAYNQSYGFETPPKSYGGRNSYRMPSYHRMDLGMNFHKQKKRGVRTWNISIYNAYSHNNPFMLAWEKDYDNPVEVPVYAPNGDIQGYEYKEKTVLKQYGLFPFIPSVSYSFKF